MNKQLPPQAQQLLEQLNEIESPEPVGIWPLAPGWWLLLALALGALGYALWWLWQQRRRQAYRKVAINQLLAMKPESSPQFVSQVSALLKRCVLTAYPQARHQVGRLHGQPWVDFLNQCCARQVFTGAAAHALANGLYQPQAQIDSEALHRQALSWLKKHQNAKPLSRRGKRHV